MTSNRRVLALAGGSVDVDELRLIAEKVDDAGGSLAVAALRAPALEEDVVGLEVHDLSSAAQARGPAFRRALRGAEQVERVWLHLDGDPWTSTRAGQSDVVLVLDPQLQPAAQRLSEQYRHLAVADGVVRTLELLDRTTVAGDGQDRGNSEGRSWRQRLGRAVRRTSSKPTSASPAARVQSLLAEGDVVRAVAQAREGARRAATARERADLLGDVVSWELAHGRQSVLARDAYAVELVVADEHLARGEHRAAAESFQEAMRTAFHRVLHFDSHISPLAADPRGFVAPLEQSAVGARLRKPRGRRRGTSPGGAEDRARPTRLLIATRANADYLGEIRDHFEGHPDFETRFRDFLGTPGIEHFAKTPVALVEQTLSGRPRLPKAAEAAFREHLDWADVVFVEWCTQLAALLTQVDPRDTRVVVRMHSYEAFTQWPHLMDFSRVDDMVFVSEHLRDLALAAVPALREPYAPRLHVLTNAMELSRCARPKDAEARFTLGVVGASKMVKDPRWAIEVLRRLREHDSRYRLQLLRGKFYDLSAGTTDYARALEQDLRELEPIGAVQVLKHTDDVPGALQAVGVVLSASVRESFHMGLVEGAASAALPVVRDWPFFPGAARRLFPEEWVVDGPANAAARILALTQDEQVWRDAGEAAARHAVERWDWAVVQRDYEELLRG